MWVLGCDFTLSTHPTTQAFDHYFGAEGIKTGDVIAFVWVKEGLLTEINSQVRERAHCCFSPANSTPQTTDSQSIQHHTQP